MSSLFNTMPSSSLSLANPSSSNGVNDVVAYLAKEKEQLEKKLTRFVTNKHHVFVQTLLEGKMSTTDVYSGFIALFDEAKTIYDFNNELVETLSRSSVPCVSRNLEKMQETKKSLLGQISNNKRKAASSATIKEEVVETKSKKSRSEDVEKSLVAFRLEGRYDEKSQEITFRLFDAGSSVDMSVLNPKALVLTNGSMYRNKVIYTGKLDVLKLDGENKATMIIPRDRVDVDFKMPLFFVTSPSGPLSLVPVFIRKDKHSLLNLCEQNPNGSTNSWFSRNDFEIESSSVTLAGSKQRREFVEVLSSLPGDFSKISEPKAKDFSEFINDFGRHLSKTSF
jgi:hypothetical protein